MRNYKLINVMIKLNECCLSLLVCVTIVVYNLGNS